MVYLTIRSGEDQDISWIISQLKIFSVFVGTKKQLFGNEEYVRQQVSEIMQKHCFFVAEKNGILIGFIFGFFVPHYFNPEIKTLTELAWWVVPEERGGPAGMLLLDKFIEFGKNNSDWICVGLNTKTPVKDEKILERGFKSFERSFLYQVED